MEFEALIQLMHQLDASDLHLHVNWPPTLRIHGALITQMQMPPLTEADVRAYLETTTTPAQRGTFAGAGELDFAYSTPEGRRLRVNAAQERGMPTLSVRALRETIPTLAELALPEVCGRLALWQQGLVLITGPTGSGKSTTLAAMLEHVNQNATKHIITIEDPIEYVFTNRNSLFTQREVGQDTSDFAVGLKHALRQDPDVIMVGEMRDLETISAALTAAETGHLVLATLHTPSAPEAVDRIVDVFPADQQTQIRTQLAMTLVGVLAQRLVARANQAGRIAACEIMIGTPAVRNMIREGKTPQMFNAIQSGQEVGMQTLEQALQALFRQGRVDAGTLSAYADLQTGLRRGTRGG